MKEQGETFDLKASGTTRSRVENIQYIPDPFELPCLKLCLPFHSPIHVDIESTLFPHGAEWGWMVLATRTSGGEGRDPAGNTFVSL